jgi:hypothetical protein
VVEVRKEKGEGRFRSMGHGAWSWEKGGRMVNGEF